MLDQLDKAPPLAVISFGLAAAFLWFVRTIGISAGFKAAASSGAPPPSASVALQIDPDVMKSFASAMEGLTTGLKEHGAAMKEHAAAMKESSVAANDLARNVGFLKDETNRVREELRIHREIREIDRRNSN